MEKEIIHLLKKGIMVICTRYILSTLAYGGLSIEDEKWLKEINKNFLWPDQTFLINVSPKTCAQRINGEKSIKQVFEEVKRILKL